VMSGDERGFGGITVKLLLDGIEVDSTSTADDGSFRFDGLFAGAYVVRYVIPAEYAPTVSSVRIGTAVPNPPPGTFGFSVAVTAGEVRSDANLGLRVPPVPEVTTTTSTTPEEPQPTTPPGPEPTVPPLPTLPFVPPVEQLIGGGELPKTGSDSSDIVATASILLLAGFSLLIATRKRRFQVG
jgi:LPXTG-motif cell wall-anchored protein